MENRLNETGALPKVAVAQIKPGINPRTKFKEAELLELGQSMKDMSGPVQPVVVYLDEDGHYALIAGERRWRAAKLAGIDELEVILRQRPAEKDARKMALLENMQRQDLTAWEVAMAVRDMLAMKNEFDVPIYSKGQLADELGKSPPFITWCEALLRCSEKLQNAVHAGEVEFRLAAIVGSLPTDMHEMAEMDLVFRPGGPMKREAAAEYVAEKYRRDLRKAQFKPEEDNLLPGVPECHKCPFNGANRSDVAGKYKSTTCLNPACFDRKQTAFVNLARAHTDDGDGGRMIDDPTEREKIFSFDGVTIKGESGYVAADELPDKISLVNPNAKVATWGEIMTSNGQQPTAKIVDGEGRVRVLFDAKLAHQAACADGSTVKALFKQGSAASAVSGSAKGGSGENKVAAAKKAAREAAEVKGCIVAGQSWLMKVGDNLSPEGAMEIVRLVVDRVTEPADRQWMACVLMGDPACKLDPWEVILGQSDVGGDQIPVISLALIARMMRLKGPGFISGSVGDLCTLIGYDTKKEVKAIEAAAKAAEAAVKGEDKEQLFDCDKCGGKNFTKSGLKSHNCERRQAKNEAAAEPTVDTDPKEFARHLLTVPVLVTAPNENGVFTKPVECVLRKGGARITITLATNAEGQWTCGYSKEGKPFAKFGSGSGPARAAELRPTRWEAVRNEIRSLIEHLPEAYDGVIELLKQAEALVHGGTTEPAREEEPAQQLLALVDKVEFKTGPVTLNTPALDKALDSASGAAAASTEVMWQEAVGVMNDELEKPTITPPGTAPQRGGKREKNAEAEGKAWAAYFETRSIAKAADACGLDVESVKNWHKRRKWKGLVVYLETGSLTKVAEECAVTKAEAVKWHRDLQWEAIRQAHEKAKEVK